MFLVWTILEFDNHFLNFLSFFFRIINKITNGFLEFDFIFNETFVKILSNDFQSGEDFLSARHLRKSFAVLLAFTDYDLYVRAAGLCIHIVL